MNEQDENAMIGKLIAIILSIVILVIVKAVFIR